MVFEEDLPLQIWQPEPRALKPPATAVLPPTHFCCR